MFHFSCFNLSPHLRDPVLQIRAVGKDQRGGPEAGLSFAQGFPQQLEQRIDFRGIQFEIVVGIQVDPAFAGHFQFEAPDFRMIFFEPIQKFVGFAGCPDTDQPIRERGWTHWHHLFNPRQLFTLGLFVEQTLAGNWTQEQKVMSLLGVMKCADNNSKLSGWSPLMGKELVDHVFANQALNTLSNHGTRAMIHLESSYMLEPKCAPVFGDSLVKTSDGRMLTHECEFWITDPPYADAVNYHELAEFFLGWNSGGVAKLFPSWSRGSRRPLAVTGSDENFRRSMVDCYRNLAAHMPADGMQVAMFTHQDAGVWADLTLILWAAGLRVTSAWCIATQTDSALKAGNYVQGTVLLVLRKQTGERTAFLDDVYPDVEAEVRAQLDAMTRIDDTESPQLWRYRLPTRRLRRRPARADAVCPAGRHRRGARAGPHRPQQVGEKPRGTRHRTGGAHRLRPPRAARVRWFSVEDPHARREFLP